MKILPVNLFNANHHINIKSDKNDMKTSYSKNNNKIFSYPSNYYVSFGAKTPKT